MKLLFKLMPPRKLAEVAASFVGDERDSDCHRDPRNIFATLYCDTCWKTNSCVGVNRSQNQRRVSLLHGTDGAKLYDTFKITFFLVK